MFHIHLRRLLAFLLFGFLCCVCMGLHCNTDDDDDYYVSTPDRPSGPGSGQVNVDMTFTTGGSHTNDGSLVEYRFDFGDGYLSGWSTSSSAIHRYNFTGVYRVYAQARSQRNYYYSSWSDYREISINTRQATLHAVWKDDRGNVWAGGDNGMIVCRDSEGNERLQQIARQNIYGLWGDKQMFCCGSEGVVFRLWRGKWQLCQANVDVDLHQVFGAGELIFAVGDNGTIIRWVDGHWNREKTATDANLYALWVENEHSAFAAGKRGTVLYFDGAQWMPMQVPCEKTLFGIWGTSYRDVWAVGKRGVVLHFNGDIWQIVQSPGISTLKTVCAPNGFDLYIAGEGGRLLKRTAGAWADISPDSGESIEAICPGAGEIFFAGGKMTFGRVAE